MSTTEFCVKNMRTRQVVAVFPTKQEAVDSAARLNVKHQTNEFWPLVWDRPDRAA